MTDEYQNAVKKLADYIGDTVNFAKEQMPDVAKEILAYNATIDHYWIAVFLVFTVFGLILSIVGLLTDGEGKQIFGCLLLIVGVVFSVAAYTDLVKIEQAPKLYILNELKNKVGDCKK
jgi:hypothetical protein